MHVLQRWRSILGLSYEEPLEENFKLNPRVTRYFLVTNRDDVPLKCFFSQGGTAVLNHVSRKLQFGQTFLYLEGFYDLTEL